MEENPKIITPDDAEYSFIVRIAMTDDGDLFCHIKTGALYKMALNGEYVEVDGQRYIQEYITQTEKIQPFVDVLYNEISPLYMELAQPIKDWTVTQEQHDRQIRSRIKGLLTGALLYFANGGSV